MAFKGEIALGALNTNYKYGFTIGDIYRVQGAGNLVPNNLPVANGAFVKWTADGWRHSDEHYTTSGEVAKSNADIFDDKDQADTTIEFKTDAEGAAVYDEGYYFLLGDKIYLTDSISHEGAVYTITATKKNGVIPVINSLVARIIALEEAE